MKLHLIASGLELVLLWTDVLAHARMLCKLSRVVTLTEVELAADIITLRFSRTVGGRNNYTEQRFEEHHVVSRGQVEQALSPCVWQHPLERVVQRLLAEVPALGGVFFDDVLHGEARR